MSKRIRMASISGVALLTCAALIVPTGAVAAPQSAATSTAIRSALTNAGPGAFTPAEFSDPGLEYRPGVRWWWPGGAVRVDELKRELHYLADNGFGFVEINPFEVSGGALAGDEPAYTDVFTASFNAKLEAVIAEAKSLGITVDLNMGSGWNANSSAVTVDQSMGNMALGRATVAAADVTSAAILVPAIEKSQFYSGAAGWDWVGASQHAKLQGVLISKRTGATGTSFTAYNAFNDGAKSYGNQVVLDGAKSWFIPAAEVTADGVVLDEDTVAAINAGGGDYEVVALYQVPSGAAGVDQAVKWYVVDHMSSALASEYVNDWLALGGLKTILGKYDNVRALFNDSYEFATDSFYNQELFERAGSPETNGLGYDFSKYLPTVYKQGAGTPFFRRTTTADTFLTYSLDASQRARINYDYNTLVSAQFIEGLKGFKRAANSYDLEYRQQAYNPPLDMLGAAKYVDIPEDEQASELRLIRAASGAHLYGRNLVTAEQFTLGNTPLAMTPEQLKTGFDIQGTSGVNNFFYHGYNYEYGKGTERFGENGWNAFAGIGINISENNTLAPYLDDINEYASRVNYLGQVGEISKDVAVYIPLNATPTYTEAVTTLNKNGYAWDAINDASIQAGNTVWKDGAISVNGGNVEYDAIIVDSRIVPVGTMQKLEALADAGAPVIFYGPTPNQQPGWADGKYAAEDSKVVAAVDRILDAAGGYLNATPGALLKTLGSVSDPEISYESNDNARILRRTLAEGGELAYIRNIGAAENTISVDVAEGFASYYWLDQNTGKIHPADVRDGKLAFTLAAGVDTQSSGATAQRSMAVGLLALPAGQSLPLAALSQGLPTGVNRLAAATSLDVQIDSLTVTADNLDGVRGGEQQTATFTSGGLGKWNAADFQGGQLQKVVADGIYRGKVTVSDVKNKTFKLNLGEVYTAASVKVNGVEVGKVAYRPYEVDVTKALRPGVNDVEITVTPRKANRYFQSPSGQTTINALVDAGLVGPVKLDQSETTKVALAAVPTLKVGATVSLKATGLASNDAVARWTSSDASVVRVDATGKITAVKPGNATVTVWTERGAFASAKVKVIKAVTTKTSVRLADSTITTKQQGVAIVAVKAASGSATGTVTVRVGSRAVTKTVKASDKGVVKVQLPKVPKGTYTVRAVFTPSGVFAGSTSTSITLRVR